MRNPSLSESDIDDIETTLQSILTDRAGINIVEYRNEEQIYDRFGDQLDEVIKHGFEIYHLTNDASSTHS